jgi:hypothetical protein
VSSKATLPIGVLLIAAAIGWKIYVARAASKQQAQLPAPKDPGEDPFGGG